MEYAERRVVHQGSYNRGKARNVLPDQKITGDFANLIVEWGEVVQLEMVFHETGKDKSLHQSHQEIPALDVPVGFYVKLQVSHTTGAVGIGDDIHLPHAPNVLATGHSSSRKKLLVIIHVHLLEAVLPGHGKSKHATSIWILSQINPPD